MTAIRSAALHGALTLMVLAPVGCLRQEASNNLYVEPSGRVTWMIVQQDVRSDEQAPAARDAEEQEFLRLARAAQNPVARGMRRLDAEEVDVRVVRDARPFLVVTIGRFRSLDGIFTSVIEQLRINGSVSLARTAPGESTLTLQLPMEMFEGGGASDEEASRELDPLFDGELRIVLERGRFGESSGFRIDDERRTATWLDPDRATAEPWQPIVYRLTWASQ